MKTKKHNALEAMSQAQILTFYPMVFQAIIAAKKLGILSFLDEDKKFLGVEEIAVETEISEYGVRLLLDMLEKVDVVERDHQNRFKLSNVGFFLLHDNQTSINLDFVNEVCYKGAFYLTESINNGKPVGLKEFGPWDTVYEGLMGLPHKAQESWFKFDHYYSDSIFKNALPEVFYSSPSSIMDIGGNTGKFTIEACQYDADVNITIVDLPKQLKVAKQNISHYGFCNRVDFISQNMLENNFNLPNGKEVIWMSQFLDCFSESEIKNILDKVAKASNNHTRVLIVETFWDNQKYDAAEYCLLGTSLYFTCIANGTSRMYSGERFKHIINQTQLELIKETQIGEHHTLLELKKKELPTLQ